MNLDSLQAFMRDQRIDGWLIHDFRGNNPVLARLLRGKRWTTRRVALFVPAHGSPALLVHSIDASQFADAPVEREVYMSWRELHAWLERTLLGAADRLTTISRPMADSNRVQSSPGSRPDARSWAARARVIGRYQVPHCGAPDGTSEACPSRARRHGSSARS